MIKAALKFLAIFLGVFLIMLGLDALDHGVGYLSESTDQVYWNFLLALVLTLYIFDLQTDE